MSKQTIFAALLIAAVGFFNNTEVSAQGCTSCAQAAPMAAVAVGCDSCAAAAAPVASFGFPAASGCSSCQSAGVGGGCRGGACRAELKARRAHQAAINAKIYARNEAWPAPFDCGSRQLYHAIFRPQIDAGYEDQNILTETHFDVETGELTRYGIEQVKGMMLNMPRHRRVVFVQQAPNEGLTQQRMAKVQNVIDTYYSQRGGMVRASIRTPAKQYGLYAEKISNLRTDAIPDPVIPIASTNDSISGSGN